MLQLRDFPRAVQPKKQYNKNKNSNTTDHVTCLIKLSNMLE